MDEYNQGMDPEVKRYFKKIINSFSWGMMWLMTVTTLGLFFDLAIVRNGIQWYNIVFYLIAISSFIGLIYYYYRLWNKKE